MVKAQIGDVMKVSVQNPRPQTIIIPLTTQKQADFANELLSDPTSGWRLEKVTADVAPGSDAVDATRWRALIGCARVRVLGSAGLHQVVGTTGYAHIGVEFWTHHEAKTDPAAIEDLTAFTDRVAAVRLARIKQLMVNDPDPATADGQELLRLVGEQEKAEAHLMRPESGPTSATSPSLLAYEHAMQAYGVPREPLEVYTSNSWRRVGLASKHHIVMAPTVWSDGHPDIDCPVVLHALVAAFNAMLELPKWQPIETAPLDGTEILVMRTKGRLVVGKHDGYGWFNVHSRSYFDNAKAWMPKPVYVVEEPQS